MTGWLLLTIFICLRNQLSSIIHSIHVLRLQMFEKCDSSNRHGPSNQKNLKPVDLTLSTLKNRQISL